MKNPFITHRLLIPIPWIGWVHFYSGNQLNHTNPITQRLLLSPPDRVCPFKLPAGKMILHVALIKADSLCLITSSVFESETVETGNTENIILEVKMNQFR